MSFVNDADFQDDFRKVGKDATADFEAPGLLDKPTEYASSENLDVAGNDDADDDLEDDDDLDEEDDEDPDDDDLEDDADDDDLEDDDEDEEEDDDLDDDDEDEEPEDDDDAVKARLGDAESRVRATR